MAAPKLPGKYQVSSTIIISASKEEAWAVLRDFPNVYTWAPSVKVSSAIGNVKELGVGAGRHCVLDGFGAIDEYITHWQEGDGLVYDVTPLGPLNNGYSSWWLTQVDEQTTSLEVVISYDLRFGLLGKLMHALVMRSKLEKSLIQGTNSFKTRVETGELVRPYLQKPTVSKQPFAEASN